LYRDVTTGRWVTIARKGQALASGAFAGRTFTTFDMRAPIDVYVGGGACFGATIPLAVFSAKVKGAAPNTGVFLYNAATDTLHDVAIEGAPSVFGGTWASFNTTHPVVVIDSSAACTAHVIFRGKATGVAAASDTGIVDARFSLPGVTLTSTSTVVREGVTSPPSPFPVGSLFEEFPALVQIAARQLAIGSVALAFVGAAKIGVGGIGSGDNTGVFTQILGYPLTVVAREGTTCTTPGWPGAGTEYDTFVPKELDIDVLGGAPASAIYRAKSRGGSTTTDTAIEIGSACPTSTVVAAEGAVTPIGGNYGNFHSAHTKLSASNARLAFAASVTNLANTVFALFHGVGGPPSGAVVRRWHADTAIGDVTATVEGIDDVGVNDGGGDVVLEINVDGYAPDGIFFFNPASATPAEMVAFRGRNPRIDTLGNMTALFK
jgi:hypothetical protein